MHHSIRFNVKAPLALTLLVAVSLAMPACKDKHESAAKDEHATPAKDSHDHAADDKKGDGHKDEARLTAEAIERYGVRLDAASKKELRETITSPARAAFNALGMAHVGSPLRGRVVELDAKVGDEVVKGGTLLVVESPELGEAQSDFLLKRSLAVSAEPAVDLAKNSVDRARKLNQESQGISLTEVQKREAEYRAAQATLQGARAAATAAENRLHLLGMDQPACDALVKSGEIAPRITIRSPLAGQVIESEITLGELVSPDREAIFVVADLSTLWVIADVPESRLRSIAKGARAIVGLGAEADEPLEGTVSYIAPSLNTTTRTGRVRIEVRNGHSGLRPGMFAQAEIELAGTAAETIVAIPDAAVQTIEGETIVFVPVEGEPNTFTKRVVKVGRPVGRVVPIVSGLKEGERFVVSGSFILKAELGKSSVEAD
jgi:cobalt-zinc-cadmium efflux system membrane fusion protein